MAEKLKENIDAQIDRIIEEFDRRHRYGSDKLSDDTVNEETVQSLELEQILAEIELEDVKADEVRKETVSEDLTMSCRTALDKKLSVAVIAVLSVIFVGVGILMLALPRETFSESEKRNLAVFPTFSLESFFKGEFTADISEFYSDTVPFREEIKAFANDTVELFGVRYDNVKLHGIVMPSDDDEHDPIVTINTQATQITQNSQSESVSVTGTPSTLATDETIPNDMEPYDPNKNNNDIINNGILVVNNQGLMLYGGSLSRGKTYAKYINKYKQELDSSVRVYCMVMPTAVEFYLPEKYSAYSKSQLDNINNIYNNLSEVEAVDVYTILSQHTNEKIYFRTDHHWTSIGAFYAAQTFCEQAGVEFKGSLAQDYTEKTISGYVGSLYGYTNDSALRNNPEDFVYYMPKNNYSVNYYYYEYPNAPFSGSLFKNVSLGLSYCTYMGGDNIITQIKTDVGNGRKLAIFKDSYGNAMVPFFVGSFEEIHVLDIRYFPHNAIEYLQYYGITDVLFANNAFGATSSLVNYIETNRTQSDYSGQAIFGGHSRPVTTVTTVTTTPTETTEPTTTTTPPTTAYTTPQYTMPTTYATSITTTVPPETTSTSPSTQETTESLEP